MYSNFGNQAELSCVEIEDHCSFILPVPYKLESIGDEVNL